jgi:endonuclease VIII-like 1
MPEIAEVKIMSDFINYVASREKFFTKVEKSPVSKVKTDLDIFEGSLFSITAKSRGKELMIKIDPMGSDINHLDEKRLLVTLGMSGNFAYVKKDSEHFDKIMKHAHLRFETATGNYLILHDVRRFAKWKWGAGWNKGRGFDPLTEFNKFSEHLRLHWYKHKAFNAPLNELLMNQSFFNGIGNYLRAEILYRMNINPFQPANQLSQIEIDSVIRFCHLCSKEAYVLGGGELKDWVNPEGSDKKSFQEWMLCYGKTSSVVDKTGRRFWYDPQWEEYIPENYKK